MKTRILYGLLLAAIFAIAYGATASAAVASCQALGSAMNRAAPGDTITVNDGIYSCGEKFSISRSGTASDRIVIEAANQGEAVFVKRTRLEIDGDFTTVEGFKFDESAVIVRGDHNRVAQNLFVDRFDLEAESGDLEGNMQARDDRDASRGRYISDEVGGGSATYTIHIPTVGTYAVWMRVQSINGGANSFFVAVDGDEEVFQIFPPTSEGYVWRQEREVDLGAGEVEIRVRTRERNTRLDRIIVTNNLGFNPNAPMFELEAEDGNLIAPTQVQMDPAANGGAYIDDRSGGGSATYTIDIPTAGTYAVWLRVQSINGGANSFFVAVDGDEEVFQIFPPTSDGYIWRQEREVDLGAGEVKIQVRTRERKTRLDQLLVAGDLAFSPSDALDGAVHVIGGHDNKIDFNEIGPWDTYGIRVRSQGHRNHIHNNYIHDFVGKQSNGNEGIQLGSHGNDAADEAENLVEYNLLERVEIDAELISVKTSSNTVQFNTFRNSDSTVGTRQGHDSRFIANIVEDVDFVRSHGADHQFIGNCISNANLILEAGDEPVDFKETTSERGCVANRGHPPAEGTIVAGNILSGGAEIRVGRRRFRPQPTNMSDLMAENGDLTEPMQIQEDSAADGGEYIVDEDGGGEAGYTVCIPSAGIFDREAEDGDLTAPAQVRSDTDASSAAYVDDRSGGGAVTFTYEIPISTASTHAVWLRVESRGGGANSFFVSVDGDENTFHIRPSRSNGYIWLKEREMALDAGEVEIRVRTREKRTRLDRIL